MFGILKDWRRIHTRYDRYAHTLLSATCTAASVIFLLPQRVLGLDYADVSNPRAGVTALEPRGAYPYLTIRETIGSNRLKWAVRICEVAMIRDVVRRVIGLVKIARLHPKTRRVVRDRLTYLPVEKLRRLERSIRETKKVPGDLVEFGVALGGSGIILAQDCRSGRRFHGFDVFGMIPPPTSDKDDDKSRARYHVIKSGVSEGINGDDYYGYRQDLLSDVKASFARHGVPVDEDIIQLHKGLFEDTWDSTSVGAIALAHIDCDWYDPVAFCLKVCSEKLSDGGLIIIDDYNDYGGCRTAVVEFLSARPDFIIEPGVNPILRKRVA